jgi:putative DNA primase/helicase
VEYNPPSSKTSGHIHKFKPKGTKERNKEIIDFYNQDGMELQQLTVCAGFGTVLMPLTGLFSLGIHLFGETGGGKTTAMFTGTSIWGDPRGLIGTGGDTPNSKMNQAELYHSIPMNTDELTNFTPREASQYAYQLSEGVQKNRMAGGGNHERVRGKPWRLLAFSTGNTSMYSQMSMFKGDTKAEMQRLLELRTDEMPRLKIIMTSARARNQTKILKAIHRGR